MEIKTFAKINLSLNIIGKQDNGYHKLNMIMQTISLYDTISISEKNNGISISTNNSILPTGSDNIAYKAAELMFKDFNIDKGLNIHIDKNIPMGAGLAGGSTNAAGVIKLINEMYRLNLNQNEMDNIAIRLGADVPFCLRQGTYLAEGIGENLVPIKKGFKNQLILLVKPNFSVSTKDAFSKVKGKYNKNIKTDKLIKSIEIRNLKLMERYMENDLEKIVINEHNEILKIKKELRGLGAIIALMTGSGPTVYGIFDNKDLALKAKNKFLKKYKETFLVYTL